jgi:hypothetical protein
MRTPTGGLYLRIRHEGANVAGMLEDRVATATTHDYGFVREQVRAERVPPSALVLWSVNCASASQRGGRSADDVTPGTSRLEIGGSATASVRARVVSEPTGAYSAGLGDAPLVLGFEPHPSW